MAPAGSASFGEKRERIRAALARGMAIVYQPVVDIRRGTIVGVEALARFRDRTPDVWFKEAWTVGLGLELEVEAIRRALLGAEDLPPHVYVAVNAAPETLLSDELFDLVTSFDCERIVVEVTEHAAVEDYGQLNAAIARLRARGVRLAIDDVGAGFSSFQHVLNLQPDTLKLDRSLTNHVDENPVLAALAAALVTLAGSLGAKICAEGIETVGELVALQKLGVTYGQGFFLARPGPLPLPQLPQGVWTARELGARVTTGYRPSPAVLSPARLDALHDTRLLDSVNEEELDHLTRLAARALGVPLALVSLVDDHRQFFKSAHGLPEPLASARETALTHSFCQHTVTTQLPLIIEDARQHPLVHDNGAVADLGVMAYLGIPLVTSDGHVLGAFCAISPTPRAWSPEDLALMQSIAATVMRQIELRAELARHEERDELHRQVVTSACSAIFVADIGARVKVASMRFCELLGYTPSEVNGKRLRSFVHPDDVPAGIELHRRLLTGEISEAQLALRALHADGEPVRVRFAWRILRQSSGRACLTTGSLERLELDVGEIPSRRGVSARLPSHARFRRATLPPHR